jgi:hypothetical protein
MAKRTVLLTKEGDKYVFRYRNTGKEILRTDCPHRAKDYALSIRRNSRNTIDVLNKIKESKASDRSKKIASRQAAKAKAVQDRLDSIEKRQDAPDTKDSIDKVKRKYSRTGDQGRFIESQEIISFRDFFLTENVYIRDQDEWVMLYHEMWWDFIERAYSEATEDVKEKIQGLKPGYIITGPTEQVNFYEINEPPSPHVVFQKKHLFEDQGPDRVFSIHEYTLEDVKNWWEEQMEHYGKYKAGTLNMEPPDPADMWKYQDDKEDPEELVKRLKSAIENLEPAEDVKWIYWDAVQAGADKDQLDADLQHYVKIEYLTQEEVDMIKTEPGEPGDRN